MRPPNRRRRPPRPIADAKLPASSGPKRSTAPAPCRAAMPSRHPDSPKPKPPICPPPSYATPLLATSPLHPPPPAPSFTTSQPAPPTEAPTLLTSLPPRHPTSAAPIAAPAPALPLGSWPDFGSRLSQITRATGRAKKRIFVSYWELYGCLNSLRVSHRHLLRNRKLFASRGWGHHYCTVPQRCGRALVGRD